MKRLSIIYFLLTLSIAYCVEPDVTNVLSSTELIAQLEDTKSFHSNDSVKEIISKLGESGDKKAISALQRYLTRSESKRPGTIGGYTQVALAKLGDDNAFNEIIQQTKTNDPIIHHESFIKLGMIGNEKAINTLGQYLFIDEPPPRDIPPAKGPHGEQRQDVVKFFRPSYLAAQTLETIFRDKSPTQTKPRFYDEKDIQKWREWWQANSNKYCHSTSGANRGVSQNLINVLTTNNLGMSQPSTNSLMK